MAFKRDSGRSEEMEDLVVGKLESYSGSSHFQRPRVTNYFHLDYNYLFIHKNISWSIIFLYLRSVVSFYLCLYLLINPVII